MVGTGHRYGEQVAGPDVTGQFRVGREDVTGLAVPAHHGDRTECGSRTAPYQMGCVARAVQGGPRIVAHAAVHRDEHLSAGVLDGQHPVQGDPGRPDHGPAGLDGEPGDGQPGGGTAVDELRAQPPGEGGEVEGGLAGPVGDAVAAAHVQLGQGDTVRVTDAGHQADHAAQGHQVGLRLGDLGAYVAVQAGQFEPGLVQDPRHGVLRRTICEGQAELLAVRTGADLVVTAGRDARHHAHHDLLPLARGDRGRDPGDLRRTVDDDPPHAEPQGHLQVAGRLRVAVQHDALRREAGRDGELQLPGGARVQAEALLPHPAGHPAGQERLGRVQHVGVGEGVPVDPAAFAHLTLVEDVDGGTEALGHLRQ